MAISSATLSFAASAKWNRGHRRCPSLKDTVTSQCSAGGKKKNLLPTRSSAFKNVCSYLLKALCWWGFWVVYLTGCGCQPVGANTKRRGARVVIQKMGFIHMLMSRHTNHILFDKRKAPSVPGGQSRLRGATALVSLRPARSLAPSSTPCYLLRKIVVTVCCRC